MSYEAINFRKKFALFDEQWQPRVIAEMNDYQFKVVKLQGDFIWHDHKNTDETFIVLEGDLRIDFRDGAVHLSAGEMFVVADRISATDRCEYRQAAGAFAEALIAVSFIRVVFGRWTQPPCHHWFNSACFLQPWPHL